MSRADVVVFTVGNSAGKVARHDRPRPANVRVAVAVPATALLAAAADGPQSNGWLDPVPRSSKLTRVNWSFTPAGTRDARIGSIRRPLSPGPPGLKTMTPLLCTTGRSMTANGTEPSEGWR